MVLVDRSMGFAGLGRSEVGLVGPVGVLAYSLRCEIPRWPVASRFYSFSTVRLLDDQTHT